MVDLFGTPIDEAMRRVGSLSQLANVECVVDDNGPGRGSRRLRLTNGSGVEIELHPDRALDIGRVTAWGTPVAWHSPAGFPTAATYEPTGLGWLRTFGGGLVTTCGLDTFGPPSHDGGEDFGLHGRIGVMSARLLRCEVTDRAVVVEGEVHQVRALHENLRLRRRVEMALGEPTIVVHDTVTNLSSADAVHMILYHCNFGWPLIDEHAELAIGSSQVQPRDEVAQRGLATWNLLEPPQAGAPEYVFRHVTDVAQPVATIRNNARELQVELQYSGTTLGSLYEWKLMGVGDYVLGLEPANCPTLLGRHAARELDVLPVLSAGDSAEYELKFSIHQLAGR